MISDNKMKMLRKAKERGVLSSKMQEGLSPEQIEELNAIPTVPRGTARTVPQEDMSEMGLAWEGMKAGLSELGQGARQFGYHTADKLGDYFDWETRPSPETMRRVDMEADQYGDRNKYSLMGKDPSKQMFGSEYFSGFNPYKTGKFVSQLGVPLGWLNPKKANLLDKGWRGIKDRAKFGGKVGLGYGVAMPTSGGENYWTDKGVQIAGGTAGGIVGGELFSRIVGAGVGAANMTRKAKDVVMNLVGKIERGEVLPQNIMELGSGVQDVSATIQARMQSILNEARGQGGVVTPDQARKIATYESIGYPEGTKGAEKFPYEPMTPAQATQSADLASQELLLEGNPLYKQKLRDQQRYMTGAVEKVSEELQGKPLAGEAGYPSSRQTGKEVASVADAMSDRLRAKTGRMYSQATKEYGKARVKPENFMKAQKELEGRATATRVLDTVAGYTAQIRDAMKRQAYKGQRGTMKTDMWSSSAGKPQQQPTADSLNVATLEGIRKTLTRQINQEQRAGNTEGASVLRELRKAIDMDVEKSVGLDVYKAGRSAHEAGMRTLDIPVVNKVLQGKYNDDFAKIVDDVKKMPYEQLLKLKQGMYKEGDTGKVAFRRLAAQIWHDMKEAGIRGYEGHGQGRNVSIPTIETQLKNFSKSARGLGANSEKGKLLFGNKIANEITNIMKVSRDLEIMGTKEVRTGWGAAVNLLDWGSKLLGRVPSLQARGISNLAEGTKRAIEEGAKRKQGEAILKQTMGGPILPSKVMESRAVQWPRNLAVKGGAIEGTRKKRGILGGK